MTTTAAGDAAVARLNKATEAFEKIITGASNQVVDVPGYGNQPTLAGRVDLRLDETTATAAAEANRSRDEADRSTTQANAAANSVTLATAEFNKAKTQADRAQSEADRAAQITGLDTVSDAVALAALPLPDVWAPLSDSLRLITGYGRDVLVGSDVVARMVNFSRNSTATYIGKDGQLKTAAANEPRFEKEGLLIEGQSQNLWPTSEGASQLGAAASTAVTASGFNLRAYSGTESAAKDVVVPQSTTITVSAVFLVNGTQCKLAVQSRDGQGFTSWFGIDASGNVSVHPTVTFASVSSVRVGNAVRVAVTLPPLALTTTLRLYRWDSTSVQGDTFGCIQVEQLPFASSYIPTAGAAVTRATDRAWIQTAGNIATAPFTFALEVNFKGVNASNRYARQFTCGPACYAFFTDTGVFGRFNTSSSVSGFSLNPIGRSVSGMVFDGKNAKLFSGKKFGQPSIISSLSDVDVSGDITLGSTTTLSVADTLFGHIRNVRIWQRTLSDDQIKAIA
ncbi:phage head spike fiber domain-containing protein [Aeromonas veronii]|uniref:phage head spike fiber domain-containing protein n=1 Tax=Aeromonas veronii TaxID=654 RepID=UPI003F78FBA8